MMNMLANSEGSLWKMEMWEVKNGIGLLYLPVVYGISIEGTPFCK
jgi:hypothetical protein